MHRTQLRSCVKEVSSLSAVHPSDSSNWLRLNASLGSIYHRRPKKIVVSSLFKNIFISPFQSHYNFMLSREILCWQLLILTCFKLYVFSYRFICLLEYAEEVLQCTDIIVCMKKDRADRGKLINKRHVHYD